MREVVTVRRAVLAVLLLAVLLIPGSAWAPGNCSIFRSWNTGETLTAGDLTTSFTTVGVTNATAPCLDDYSADVTQMRLNTDPFPSGVESLPTSLAGELERLRFVIKKFTGWSQWYAHNEPTAIIQGTQTFRGLFLRTHPDPDKVAAQIMLVRADEIVLDTGHPIADWGPLTANITVSGAGGLDTGSEQASTWYQILAIRKSSDGTKNLLLHRAKDYLEDESQTTEDGGHALRRASAPVNTQLGQGFQVDTAGKLEFIDLQVLRTGAVSGNVWLEIRSDASGLPSSTVLATSDKIDASKIQTASQRIRVPFRTPFTTVAATQYHVVLLGDYTASDTVNITWRADTSAATYANGAKSFFDGATWTSDTDDDFAFRIYVTRNDTAVTMPSGYDQKALIGYAFNDSGSNFIAFLAEDRLVTIVPTSAAVITNGANSTTPKLAELQSNIPPGAIGVSFAVAGDGTNEKQVSVTGLGNVDPGQGSDADMWATTRSVGNATNNAGMTSLRLPVEYQAVYTDANITGGKIYAPQWRW